MLFRTLSPDAFRWLTIFLAAGASGPGQRNAVQQGGAELFVADTREPMVWPVGPQHWQRRGAVVAGVVILDSKHSKHSKDVEPPLSSVC